MLSHGLPLQKWILVPACPVKMEDNVTIKGETTSVLVCQDGLEPTVKSVSRNIPIDHTVAIPTSLTRDPDF